MQSLSKTNIFYYILGEGDKRIRSVKRLFFSMADKISDTGIFTQPLAKSSHFVFNRG